MPHCQPDHPVEDDGASEYENESQHRVLPTSSHAALGSTVSCQLGVLNLGVLICRDWCGGGLLTLIIFWSWRTDTISGRRQMRLS
jgi:hypothetical protein